MSFTFTFLAQSGLVSILPWVLVCLLALLFIYSSTNQKRPEAAAADDMDEREGDASPRRNPRRVVHRINGYVQLIMLAGFIALIVAVVRHGHEIQRQHAVEESATDAVLAKLQRQNADFRGVYTYQDRNQFSICGELRTPQEMALLKERIKESLGLDDGRVDYIVRVHLRSAADTH